MAPAGLAAAAERLRALHDGPDVLVLANAWDVASATAVTEAGLPAVATSSAAIAKTLGEDDTDSMPPDLVFSVVARVAAAVSVPVTADLEAGYRLAPDEIADRLLSAGAVGCNLEDTDHHGDGVLVPAEAQAERLAAVKAAARAAGVDIVLNARVDVHLREVGDPAGRVAEMVRRGRLYRAAGADCVYPIGVADERVIGALLEEIGGPLNVLLRPGTPPLSRLAEVGVARVSLASGLFRTSLAAVKARLAELTAEAAVKQR